MFFVNYGDQNTNKKAEILYDSGTVTKNQLIFSLREKDIERLFAENFKKNGKPKKDGKR